jgi:4-hydroxy-tetrahydrodipicolinate synthase
MGKGGMNKKPVRPEGSWVALVTPFDARGEVDMGCFRRLVDFHVASGTDGLIFMGSTGESPSLSMEERQAIIAEMSAYCRGKIPAFHGVTCSTTAATTELARFSEAQGADGVMMVVPPYLAPPQNSTIIKLAGECPNLVADKEAVPSVGQLVSVLEGTQGKLQLLCCDAPNYAIIIPTLALGGHGTANVAGNVIPREMAQMSRPWKSWQDVWQSRKVYFENLPVMEASYSHTNPVAIKAMVKLLGFPVGEPRPPLPSLTAQQMRPLEELLSRLKIRERYEL